MVNVECQQDSTIYRGWVLLCIQHANLWGGLRKVYDIKGRFSVKEDFVKQLVKAWQLRQSMNVLSSQRWMATCPGMLTGEQGSVWSRGVQCTRAIRLRQLLHAPGCRQHETPQRRACWRIFSHLRGDWRRSHLMDEFRIPIEMLNLVGCEATFCGLARKAEWNGIRVRWLRCTTMEGTSWGTFRKAAAVSKTGTPAISPVRSRILWASEKARCCTTAIGTGSEGCGCRGGPLPVHLGQRGGCGRLRRQHGTCSVQCRERYGTPPAGHCCELPRGEGESEYGSETEEQCAC